MRQIYVVLFFIISIQAQAQFKDKSVERKGPNIRSLAAEVKAQQHIRSEEKEPFTALAIRFKGSPEGAFIAGNALKSEITIDEHYTGEGQISNLIIFDKPVNKYEFYTGGISGQIEVIYINAGQISEKGQSWRLEDHGDKCEAPAQVDQSSWRAGLSTPDYSRSFTVTENIIIHHSATSNELTNYTNVVRNIYLFHTQSNGWSDIGYNYLIAPDGTIYKGRDPAEGAQDLVIGAHFCGKNSTTMGVCLLGTYTNTAPSTAALEALTQLMAWKADKDELNPLGIDPHPLNSLLPVIAGHRDGCSTECPGQQTYERLPQIRTGTAQTIEECHEEDEELIFTMYPNPADFYFKVELVEGDLHQFSLYTMKGHYADIQPINKFNNILTFSVKGLAAGMYILHYQTEKELIKRRLVILN